MSSPSKLFSCVEAVAILKSPHNTSTAKNHWSFSKDSRFKDSKLYCETFYNIPETKSDRKAGNYHFRKVLDMEKKQTYNLTKTHCM